MLDTCYCVRGKHNKLSRFVEKVLFHVFEGKIFCFLGFDSDIVVFYTSYKLILMKPMPKLSLLLEIIELYRF